MNGPVVYLKAGNQSLKVPSAILRLSSQYFDALFRFSPNSVGTIIELDEPLGEAFCFVIGNLLSPLSANGYQLGLIAPDRMVLNQSHQQEQSHLMPDFLFDCVLVSSKYLLGDFERYYSQLLVLGLRKCGANYSCSDVILPPPATSMHLHLADDDRSTANYLSLLQIRGLAQVFNLHYLDTLLSELIQHKRILDLNRLRKLYFCC